MTASVTTNSPPPHFARTPLITSPLALQPAALRSERSGLLESASVMILREIFRSHAFSLDLKSLYLQPVTPKSWRPGDWVMSAKLLASASLLPGMSRVVADSGRARDPAQISLETIEGTKRLNVSKNAILHSAFYHVEDEDK